MTVLGIEPVQVLRLPSEYFTLYSCREDALASLLKWLHMDYYRIYAGSWNFSFRNGELKYEERNYPLLQMIYGIRMVPGPAAFSRDEGPAFVEEQLAAGLPVLMGVDCYWVPWDSGYQTNHNRGHFFLVVDVDRDRESLTCVDGYFEQTGARLSFDHASTGFSRWFYFERTEAAEPRDVAYWLKDNSTEEILRFSEAIGAGELNFDIRNRNLYTEEGRSRLWGVLSRIADGRVEYSIFLREYERSAPQAGKGLSALAEQLWTCGEQWHLAKLQLERYMLRPGKANSGALREASARMAAIARREQAIMDEITARIGSRPVSRSSP